jgi:hypothetical protein
MTRLRLTALLLPLLLGCLTSRSLPSPADTLKTGKKDSTLVFFFNNNLDKFGRLNLHTIDTAVTGAQIFDPLNTNSLFHATLGTMGSASLNLEPGIPVRPSGFDFGVHSFDGYLFKNDSVRYFKVMKTFSELKYEQGAKKQLLFDVVLSRNLYKSLNLGFDFRALKEVGAYQRQVTNALNLVVTAQYFTKDKRYAVIANFLFNRIKNQENGGIVSDSLFTQNLESNRFVIPVNLNNAQNRVKESGFYAKNYFNLTRKPREADSTQTARRGLNLGRVIYTIQYNRQVQNYIDFVPNSGFYPNIYLDSTETYDSITIKKLSNELAWTNPMFNPEKKFKTLQLDLRVRYDYIDVTETPGKHVFMNQWIPSAGFALQPYSGMMIDATGDYVFGDYNGGDFNLRVNLSQVLGGVKKNGGTLALSGVYSLQQPSWYFEHYYGNNFRWDTSFQKQWVVAGIASWSWKFLHAGASVSRIKQFVYLDMQALPAQLDQEFGYVNTWINAKIPAWRFLFDCQLAYQTVQGTDVLSLPAFLGSLRLYYSQPLLKGAAILQPGLNFFYNTLYYSNGYMPGTRSFYLQKETETGNYIYMDVFINMKIQRARFFIMYSHFNAGFMGRNYFMVPNYPMPDAGFRFGISWRFFD